MAVKKWDEISLPVKQWDENTDYSALLNAAMDSGSTDADYMQSLLDARNEKLKGANYSQYNNPEYTNSVQEYINNIRRQNQGSNSGSQQYDVDTGLSSNGLYRTDVDYKALIQAAMDSGSTDADYLQDLLNARTAKTQDPNYAMYDEPEYNMFVQDYINNLRSPNQLSGSGEEYIPQNDVDTGLSSNGLYRTDIDYKALLQAAMDSGNTDADYLQGLLNARMAKTQDDNYAMFDDPEYNKTVQNYINNLRNPAPVNGYDIDSIIAQIQSAIGPEPTYESRWDDTANMLAQAALDMSYDKWTGSDQYAALADRYGRQGKLTMQDVLGQISSRTGGLASSYAATVANQKYNEYMAMLEEVARQMYNSERNDALANAQLAMNYSDRDYDRYLDELSRYGSNRNFAYQVLADAMANSKYNQEWDNKLKQQELENQRSSQTEAQKRISNYLAAGGAVSALDDNLIASSGYTMPELYALEKYYTKAGGSGNESGDNAGDNTSNESKWTDVDNWVIRFGADAADDYVKEHYKDLGYSSEGSAIAGWNNHMREVGGINGLQGTGNGNGSGSGSNDSGSGIGNNGNNGPNESAFPAFDDYSEAVAYMKRNGVPNANASGAMTKSEWTRKKAAQRQYGTGGAEVRDYDTYSEYLTAYAQYCIETYGK